MPSKTTRDRVPSHTCTWYPISRRVNGEPVLYACGSTMRCSKTMTQKEYLSKRDKPDIVERPYDDD